MLQRVVGAMQRRGGGTGAVGEGNEDVSGKELALGLVGGWVGAGGGCGGGRK